MAAKDENYDALEATKPAHVLFSAVSSSKLRLVRLLIDGGLHVDIQNTQHQTPLLAACSSLEKCHFQGETRERVVKYLIEAGANVNAQDKGGRTPLIYAVITQAQASVIFDLVEAGADLWLQDDNRNCAFDYAVQREDVGQVGVMVEAYKRWNSSSGGEADRLHKKLAGMSTFEKMHAVTPTSATKHNHKVEISRNQGAQKKYGYKAMHQSILLEGTGVPSKTTSNVPSRPERPVMSPPQYEEKQLHSLSKSGMPYKEAGTPCKISSDVPTVLSKQFCTLCKTVILSDREPEAVKDLDGKERWKSANFLNPNLSEYDLSGLLYRRRSTGSLLGLTQQRCESIQRKMSLGITLEDLFSTTEINCPNFDGQSLFVKNRRTNTIVDISTVGLSALDLNASPLAVGFKQKRDLVYTSDSRIFRDSDEDWDEILVKPSSLVEGSSLLPAGGGTPESGRSSSSCSPTIPRIVLTDFVQTSSEEVQQNGQE